jgi:hypothetical protein
MKPKFQRIGYALIVLVMFAPMAIAFAAGGIAVMNGCTVTTAGANPCVVFGTDLGATLYAMGVMGFFAIATIPLGGIALVLFFLFNLFWRRRVAARG